MGKCSKTTSWSMDLAWRWLVVYIVFEFYITILYTLTWLICVKILYNDYWNLSEQLNNKILVRNTKLKDLRIQKCFKVNFYANTIFNRLLNTIELPLGVDVYYMQLFATLIFCSFLIFAWKLTPFTSAVERCFSTNQML